MKPIDTQYKGYLFRSRLEARWAVFFDAVGLDWQYEPEGFQLDETTRYLPDFFLTIDLDCMPNGKISHWVEIKATEPSKAELRKFQLLCEYTGQGGFVVSGTPGNAQAMMFYPKLEGHWGYLHLPHNDMFLAETNWMLGDVVFKAPQRIAHAKTAARSARFEFGRQG